MFKSKYGVIVACDVKTLEELKRLVQATQMEGIVGYKIGFILGLKYGLDNVVSAIREFSDLPIIYDHQKAGTDIPDMGVEFAQLMKNAGINSAIIFPQAGPKTQEAFTSALINAGVVPMVGGEMTHPMYLEKDGGYINSGAPERMYENGAKLGVKYFIVPGNKADAIRKYAQLLKPFNVSFCFPGIGRQGGDIEAAFNACGGSSYAIIGSSIYKAPDISQAAKGYCDVVLKFSG